MKKLSILFGMVTILTSIFASADGQDRSPSLINVIPSSPNASALAKFGSTPVSYFTGLPNISIPLYSIRSGSLNLPVSINYHASGVKIEEIASSVGLGWALNAGGMIVRNIRGIGDDEYNGYFNKNLNMHVYDMVTHPAAPNTIESLRESAKEQNDVEADQFYFNMGGISGKFVYNQEEQKFYTIPRQDVKIEYDGSVSSPGNFKITTASGDTYYFNDIEKTTAQAICDPATANGYPHATAWCLTKIRSFDKKDSITFEYEPHIYNYTALGTETRYVLKKVFSMIPGNIPDALRANKCSQAISVENQRLRSIKFNNGSLNFHFNTGRCDLIGDNRLDDIEIADLGGTVLKKWRFSFGYFGTNETLTGCTDYGKAENYRLKLIGLQESDKNSMTTIPPYQFEYNESITLPSRNSYAQDYWGYFNGKFQNTTLIPSYIISTDNGPLFYQGADRSADGSFSGMGTISKIIYPTGGSTEYKFENNVVSNVQAQAQPQNNSVLLTGDGQGVQTYYEKEFTINYGPNDYNGHNKNGGAYVSFDFGEIGCDISQGASTCANLGLQGLTPGTTGGTFSRPTNNSYLPNGTYKMTASFEQNPANFGDFYFRARWQSPDTAINIVNKRNTGGLRVAQIIDHDKIDPAHDILRSFSYNLPSDPSASSGVLNGYPNANNFIQDPFLYHYYQFIRGGNGANAVNDVFMEFAKISSYSNKPLIQTQGSYTSYSYVTEIQGQNAENGKTIYTYSNDPDDIGAAMPYTVTNNEYRRGLLLKKVAYKKSGGDFVPVVSLKNIYTYKSLPTAKSSTGLKTYFPVAAGGDQDVDVPSLIYSGGLDIPRYEEYADTCSWIGIAKSIEQTFDTLDTTKSTTTTKEYGYSDHHYMVSQMDIINSKGDTVSTSYQYPPDYNFDTTPVSSNALGIKFLFDNNILDKVVEETDKHTSSNNVKSTFSKFNVYHPDGPVIDSVLTAKILPNTSTVISPSVFQNGDIVKSGSYEPRSEMLYNDHDNVKEQKLAKGPSAVYLWGYNNEYPIIEIRNSNYQLVSTALSNAGIDPETLAKQNFIATTEIKHLRDILIAALPNVQITSYTYDPLIGMTSMTDAKGMMTTYEYDALLRLSNVRDTNGNIIKHYAYHYQN